MRNELSCPSGPRAQLLFSVGIQMCSGFVVILFLWITSPAVIQWWERAGFDKNGNICLWGERLFHLWLHLFFLLLCLEQQQLGCSGTEDLLIWPFFSSLSSLLKSPEQQRCSGICHPSKVVVLSLAFWRVLSCLMIKRQDYGAAVLPHCRAWVGESCWGIKGLFNTSNLK